MRETKVTEYVMHVASIASTVYAFVSDIHKKFIT